MATGAVAAIALAIVVGSTPAAADQAATLSVEPAQANVAKGGVFTIRVVKDAPVRTSGAEATIVFDPAVLAIEAVAPASAYVDAPIVLPQDLGAAVSSANQTGRLVTIAAAFTPPSAVEPGAHDFLLVTFRAVGCGSTDLELPVGPVDAALIDGRDETYGQPVPVVTTAGQVTTCVAADEVTPGIEGAAAVTPAPKTYTETPWPVGMGLAGAAALLAVGFVGAFAWRRRRQGRPA